MSSVFKNPLATPLGMKLNQSVSHGQSGLNFPLIMEVCDLINDTDTGPKDAKAAFRKLLFGNKDYNQVIQTLAVLDACMKNCHKRFHKHIIQKEFLLDMVKLAQGGKSLPPSPVREKTLTLIQRWADAYRGKEDLHVAAEIYDQLCSKGIEMPAINLDDMVPMRTPTKANQPQNVTTGMPSASEARSTITPISEVVPQNVMPTPQERYASQPATTDSAPDNALTQDEMAKIFSEADVVATNVQVLSDLLLNSIPGQDKQENIDFITSLRDTLVKMQTRVMELLNNLAGYNYVEMLIARMLQLNDDINNVITRYERYSRQISAANNPESNTAPVSIAEVPDSDIEYPTLPASNSFSLHNNIMESNNLEEPNILGFDNNPFLQDNTPSLNPTALPEKTVENKADTDNLIETSELEDFDIFAKSRQMAYAIDSGSSYTDNKSQPTASITEMLATRTQSPDENIDEIAKWLKVSDLVHKEESSKSDNLVDVSSEEFDRFLSQRSAVEAPERQQNKDNTTTNDDLFCL